MKTVFIAQVATLTDAQRLNLNLVEIYLNEVTGILYMGEWRQPTPQEMETVPFWYDNEIDDEIQGCLDFCESLKEILA